MFCLLCKNRGKFTEREMEGVCHNCAPKAIWKRDRGIAVVEAVFLGLAIVVIWTAAKGLREGPYDELTVAGLVCVSNLFGYVRCCIDIL